MIRRSCSSSIFILFSDQNHSEKRERDCKSFRLNASFFLLFRFFFNSPSLHLSKSLKMAQRNASEMRGGKKINSLISWHISTTVASMVVSFRIQFPNNFFHLSHTTDKFRLWKHEWRIVPTQKIYFSWVARQKIIKLCYSIAPNRYHMSRKFISFRKLSRKRSMIHENYDEIAIKWKIKRKLFENFNGKILLTFLRTKLETFDNECMKGVS